VNTPASAALLIPVLALVALTFAVLLMIPYARFKAARERRVVPADFALGESANVPPEVRLPNRNLINLLEMPTLFYVACLALYVTGKADWIYVDLAWMYVIGRLCHSFVHLTYNNVLHRLVAFAVSSVVLLAIWVRLGWQLL
jgi:hypothetical protein